MNRADLVPFTLKVNGVKQLDLALGLMGKTVKDLSPVWADVDTYLRGAVGEQFGTTGRRGGSEWVKLSPKYKAWKDWHYPGRPILVRTGDLKQSLVEFGGNHIFRAERTSMTFGSRIPYAGYHQSGTRTMPSRPPIQTIQKKDSQAVVKIMQAYIAKVWKIHQRNI
mgnify:CR=1 FL=1